MVTLRHTTSHCRRSSSTRQPLSNRHVHQAASTLILCKIWTIFITDGAAVGVQDIVYGFRLIFAKGTTTAGKYCMKRLWTRCCVALCSMLMMPDRGLFLQVAVACHTSHVTRHTSQVTRHTSHVTRHTSHIAHHTSHITRHT